MTESHPNTVLINPHPQGDTGKIDNSSDNNHLQDSQSPGIQKWKKCGFIVLNIWLVYHLYCIVVVPMSVYPSSQLQRDSWLLAGPYVQALYLNHGWHFFAPNPSGSNMLSYTLYFADGQETTTILPNRDISPRLLYHRYFMISEALGNAEKPMQSAILKSLSNSLLIHSGAEKISFTRIYRELPSSERIIAGGSIKDTEYLSEEPLGIYTLKDLE